MIITVYHIKINPYFEKNGVDFSTIYVLFTKETPEC